MYAYNLLRHSGRLVSIADDSENTFVYTLLQGEQRANAWLGLTKGFGE